MATRSTGETVTSPGDVTNVFAPGSPDDDDDAELAKLHANDDDDEVKGQLLCLGKTSVIQLGVILNTAKDRTGPHRTAKDFKKDRKGS